MVKQGSGIVVLSKKTVNALHDLYHLAERFKYAPCHNLCVKGDQAKCQELADAMRTTIEEVFSD